MPRDPNYDTVREYKMDRDDPPKKALKRCQCSTPATIKTTYDLGRVSYHCSELCLKRWLKTNKVSLIHTTEKQAEGWPA